VPERNSEVPERNFKVGSDEPRDAGFWTVASSLRQLCRAVQAHAADEIPICFANCDSRIDGWRPSPLFPSRSYPNVVRGIDFRIREFGLHLDRLETGLVLRHRQKNYVVLIVQQFLQAF